MPEPSARSTDERRALVVVDRLENAAPGRVAFVVHRSRTVGRSRAIDGMRLLERWARRRAERLTDAAAQRDTGPRSDEEAEAEMIDVTDAGPVQAPEASDDARLADVARPDESWTKGRIYELARDLDLDGRSKLDKAELLEAMLDELDGCRDLDGPEDPVYGRRADVADVTV